MNTARVGVLGGTFDPLHNAHIQGALVAAAACALDVVIFMVSNEPWHKAGEREVSPAAIRFEAVNAAISTFEGPPDARFIASDQEIRRGGATYTIDTVEELRRTYAESTIYLILGADAAGGLESWSQADRLASLTKVILLNRPGFDIPLLDPKWRVDRIEMPPNNLSSTRLRQAIADGTDVSKSIPEKALVVYRANRLYSGVQGNKTAADNGQGSVS